MAYGSVLKATTSYPYSETDTVPARVESFQLLASTPGRCGRGRGLFSGWTWPAPTLTTHSRELHTKGRDKTVGPARS